MHACIFKSTLYSTYKYPGVYGQSAMAKDFRPHGSLVGSTERTVSLDVVNDTANRDAVFATYFDPHESIPPEVLYEAEDNAINNGDLDGIEEDGRIEDVAEITYDTETLEILDVTINLN